MQINKNISNIVFYFIFTFNNISPTFIKLLCVAKIIDAFNWYLNDIKLNGSLSIFQILFKFDIRIQHYNQHYIRTEIFKD